MMERSYCLPIVQSRQEAVLALIKQHADDYRYFEVWLDYVDGVDEAFIQQLAELLQDRLVLLFRRQGLEPIRLSLEQRLQILHQLDNTPVLIDLDVTTQTDELAYITREGLVLQIIASYHNYQSTPSSVQLNQIIATIMGYEPAVCKLATLCKTPDEALRLLEQLLRLKAHGHQAIVLGMGEAGVVTRVFGGLWGNAMTFAPLTQAEQTAPGQLTRSQLDAIFKELES